MFCLLLLAIRSLREVEFMMAGFTIVGDSGEGFSLDFLVNSRLYTMVFWALCYNDFWEERILGLWLEGEKMEGISVNPFFDKDCIK